MPWTARAASSQAEEVASRPRREARGEDDEAEDQPAAPAEDVPGPPTEGSAIQSAFVAMREAGAVLLRRAQAAGTVRPGVDLADVLRLIHGVVLVNRQTPDPERAARMFGLVIAGIQA